MTKPGYDVFYTHIMYSKQLFYTHIMYSKQLIKHYQL